MRRQDGRIEPGQSLRGAISARAWNRAQDAADVVLGQRPGFGAEAGLPTPLQSIVVTITNSAFDSGTSAFPSGVTFGVGSALDLSFSFGGQPVTLESLADRGNPPTEDAAFQVDDLGSLPTFVTERRAMRQTSLAFGHSEHFGIVRNLSRGQSTTTMDVVVGGVFSCLVYAFSADRRIGGALPIPSSTATFPKSLWLPLPTLSPAGYGQVIALGSWWRVSSAEWPRVYEALIRI